MVALLAIYGATGLILGLCGYLALGMRDIAGSERGVVLRLGKVRRVVGPGRTMILIGLDRLVRVDMRPFKLAIDIPVVTSREGTWHAASLAAECHLLQPERAIAASPSHIEATRTLLEAVFRETVAGLAAKELQADGARLGRGLKKIANEQALSWGVDIQSVELTSISRLPEPGPGQAARWEIVLVAAGVHMVRVVALVRTATGLDLAAAKQLVTSAPVSLASDMTLQAAESLRARLMTLGATVDLKLNLLKADGI